MPKSAVPNRLQENWNKMKPPILREWGRLTESDLDSVEGEFDRLVNLVKERYDGPVITVREADIRYKVLQLLKEVEK